MNYVPGYTNADLKICQYIRLHMKMISRRLHIKTSFTFLDMRKIYLEIFRNNRMR